VVNLHVEKILRELLSRRIMLLDGAMGSMIQQYKLTETEFRGERFKGPSARFTGYNDLLSLTQPHIITEIHEQYLKAGADIIETNTFSATAIAQADYALEHLAYELNLVSAQLAKAAANKFTQLNPQKPRFVCRCSWTNQ
jgi:5-methyltetrahydrofolate--homocysteine methyltransferase